MDDGKASATGSTKAAGPGAIALVTGGTRGIGKATARGLARLGTTVVIVGRSASTGADAANELREATGADVMFLQADLARQADVRRLADDVTARFDRLDVLVNNVAVVRAARAETSDGIEETLAVGHVAPFLLTELLLPALQRSPRARIVNVTSGVVRHVEASLEDLQSTRHYAPLTAYARAKHMNLAWTLGLGQRLAGSTVTVLAVDPGIADTGTHRDYPRPAPMRVAMRMAWRVLDRFLSVERAAAAVVHAASSADLDGRPALILDRKGNPVEPPAALLREDFRSAVDRHTRDLVRVDAR